MPKLRLAKNYLLIVKRNMKDRLLHFLKLFFFLVKAGNLFVKIF